MQLSKEQAEAMAKLSKQQAEAVAKVDEGMWKLVEQAIKDGRAKPVVE